MRAQQASIHQIVQPKIKIGQPNDRFEQEADRVADRVVANQPVADISPVSAGNMPAASLAIQQQAEKEAELPEQEIQRQPEEEEESLQTKLLQRQAEEEEEPVQAKLLQRQVEEEEEPVQARLLQRQAEDEEEPVQTKLLQRQVEEEEEPVQTKLIQRQAEEEEGPVQTKLLQRQEEEEAVQPHLLQRRAEQEEEEVLQGKDARPQVNATAQALNSPSGGSALRPDVKSTLESSMGADLTGVRVHEDSGAHQAAAAIHARAFTHKNDIWLGEGQSQSDLHLMAHEATHVVQQRGGLSSAQREISSTTPRVQRWWNPVTAISNAVSSAVEWVGDTIGQAVDYIKERAAEFVSDMPGYSLFTVVYGSDPITGRHVERNGRNFIEAGLDVIPNGAELKQKLEQEGALAEAAQWLDEQIRELDFSPTEIASQFASFWSSLGIADATRLPTVMRRLANIILAPLGRLRRFAVNVGKKLLQIVKDYVVSSLITFIRERTNAYPLMTVILGRDPISQEVVDRTPIALLRGFMQLSESGQEQLRQMEESGSLQRAADWLDAAVARLNITWEVIRESFSAAWDLVTIQNLLNPPATFRQLYNIFAAPVGRIINFLIEVAAKVLGFIKDALISRLVAYARTVRGYPLITVILGKDPFSEEVVERNTANIIRGFMSLMENGEQQFQEMQQSGAIARMTARVEAAMAMLNFTWEYIRGLFTRAWNSFSLSDLAAPFEAFARLMAIFASPIMRLINFVVEIIKVVIEVIMEVMNFPIDLIRNIMARALQAMDDIKRDPIGFLKNLLLAVKTGFQQFFGNILRHLLNGLTGWLFGELRDANINPPTDFSFSSILGFVLEVLGITVERIWQKLAERIGEERVARIRGMIDRLTGIWTFVKDVATRGPVAIWEYIQERLSNLWSTVLEAVRNWVMTRIVERITVRLLSMLDPTGIMAVVNGFIAFYNAVQSFIRYLREMLEIVNSFVVGVAEIARGNVTNAANFLENSLSRGMPVAIGFLANQVGLSGIGRRIGEMIERVRGLVDRALTWLVDRAVSAGSSLLNMGRNAVASVTNWWRARKRFTGADNRAHTISVDRSAGRANVVVRSQPRTLQQIIDAETNAAKKAQLQTKYNEINSLVGGSEPAASEHESRHRQVQEKIDQVVGLLGPHDQNPSVVTHQTTGGSRAHRVIADPLTRRPGNTRGSRSSGVQFRNLIEAIVAPTTVSHSTTNTTRQVFSMFSSSHLLSHLLHGPADPWNLANTGVSINGQMRAPEHRAKDLIDRGAEIAYTTTASYAGSFPPDRATIAAGTADQRRNWLRGIVAQSYSVNLVVKRQPTEGNTAESNANYGPFTDGSGFIDRLTLVGEPPAAVEDQVYDKAVELATSVSINGEVRQRIPGIRALQVALHIGAPRVTSARGQLVTQGRLEVINGDYYVSL